MEEGIVVALGDQCCRQAKGVLRAEQKEYGLDNLRELEMRKVAWVSPDDQQYSSLKFFVVVVDVGLARQSWCGREYG